MNSPSPVEKKCQFKPHFMQRYLGFSTQAPAGNNMEISLFHFIDIAFVTVRNPQPETPSNQHWQGIAQAKLVKQAGSSFLSSVTPLKSKNFGF